MTRRVHVCEICDYALGADEDCCPHHPNATIQTIVEGARTRGRTQPMTPPEAHLIIIDDCTWGETIIVTAAEWPAIRESCLDEWERDGCLSKPRGEEDDPAQDLRDYIEDNDRVELATLLRVAEPELRPAITTLYNEIHGICHYIYREIGGQHRRDELHEDCTAEDAMEHAEYLSDQWHASVEALEPGEGEGTGLLAQYDPA